MSDEKIDLAEFEEDVRAWVLRRDDTLALVRAVRASKAYMAPPFSWSKFDELDRALAPFTDSGSAEVRSDGE